MLVTTILVSWLLKRAWQEFKSNLSLDFSNNFNIISKTYMTGIEGENTRLRHYMSAFASKNIVLSFSQ
ncbi:hypothetical protein DSM106972_065930 [Dulcicalothrix desertica PCC 7102]|uniref:Uncharacterized protein n=1 Tax=Dulcicalothrix desertica PCC 7102 TaxID=232991 RepID=A0A433V5W8_9CYAN|nr:hypothetical protein DSM106972_065930 [Dulcicalothrix desertica PCC 7102]TWH43467.1 hypothetical protein CAL7102_07193 [Dulcicalothrix desertica PCC 7102]